jgi:antitoxin Phd
MGRTWQLQEAKNRFSEVVEEAIKNGPQTITRRGVETAVLISASDFRAMRKNSRSIVDLFRNSPLVGEDIDLTRDKSLPREPLEF